MTTAPVDQVGTTLLFENARVRVWDLALAPGASLAKHLHRTDYLFIVESGGLIRFADPDTPADFYDVQFTDDQVTFVPVPEGKVDNRLTNIGEQRHRNYVIELKQSREAHTGSGGAVGAQRPRRAARGHRRRRCRLGRLLADTRLVATRPTSRAWPRAR